MLGDSEFAIGKSWWIDGTLSPQGTEIAELIVSGQYAAMDFSIVDAFAALGETDSVTGECRFVGVNMDIDTIAGECFFSRAASHLKASFG